MSDGIYYQILQWTPFPGRCEPLCEWQLQTAEYDLKLGRTHYYENALKTQAGIFYPLEIAQRIIAYWQVRWHFAKYQLIPGPDLIRSQKGEFMEAKTEQRFSRESAQDEPDEAHPAWSLEAWFDTERQKIVLVRVGKNPNDYIRHIEMRLLFTDQAEYYTVCVNCHYTYSRLQWSGSTRNPGWRQTSASYLEEHIKTKGWCEFCDPVFGHGGWRLD